MVNTIKPAKLIFRKMERELLRLESDQQPDTVHGFRTTSRRLETLLEEIVSNRGRNQAKLLKLLGRIRRRAGRVRDIDVQLAAIRSLKVPLEPRRKTQLTRSLIELRAIRERKLRKLFKKKLVHEIQRRLKRAFESSRSSKSRDPLAVAKQILAAVPISSTQVNEDLLHRYRIAVKRARYAAEFALKSPKSAEFIAQLKQMQDALGSWHDWFTLTQTATQSLGEINQSSLVAAMHNVTRGKFRNAVAAISAAQNHGGLEKISLVASPSKVGDKTLATAGQAAA
ncbi:MAG: CHAD domain-containing protein [Candidatus Sulfotelmatobacter sp.]